MTDTPRNDEARWMLVMMLEALQHVEPYTWPTTMAKTLVERSGPDACQILIQALRNVLKDNKPGLSEQELARHRLVTALAGLREVDGVAWAEVVAQAVVELGGSDAGDLLGMAADRAASQAQEGQEDDGTPPGPMIDLIAELPPVPLERRSRGVMEN